MPPCPTVYSPIEDQKARQAVLSKRYDGLVRKIDGICILTGAHANLRIYTPEGATKEYATDGWDLERYIAAMQENKDNARPGRKKSTRPARRKKGKDRHMKHDEEKKACSDTNYSTGASSSLTQSGETGQTMALPETQAPDTKQETLSDIFPVSIAFTSQSLMQDGAEMWGWDTMADDWLAAATTAPDDSSFH